MSDNTADQAALRSPMARSSAGNGADPATTDVPQDTDTGMTKAVTCSCGCAFYEHYPYDGACRSCNCPEFRGCDLPRETVESR